MLLSDLNNKCKLPCFHIHLLALWEPVCSLSVTTECFTSVTKPVVVCCILLCGNRETSTVSVAMETTLHSKCSLCLPYFCYWVVAWQTIVKCYFKYFRCYLTLPTHSETTKEESNLQTKAKPNFFLLRRNIMLGFKIFHIKLFCALKSQLIYVI